MRYYTLFYAALLPAVLAQSAGTGFVHPTGGVGFSKNESVAWYSHKPTKHSSSSASILSSVLATSKIIEPSTSIKPTHKPYPMTQGFAFSNTTSGAAHSTGFAHPTGTSPRSSDTGVSHSSGRISSGVAKPTSAHPTKPEDNTTASALSSGRAPYSSQGHFFNGTATATRLASGTGISHHSGGFSSGFAKPTPATFTRPAQNIATGGRTPFSSGAHFFNGTSSAPFASGTGAFHSSGTGVIHASGTGAFSGYVKPTRGSSFTRPALNITTTSARAPFSSGAHFFNGTSTTAPLASGTGTSYPSGTGAHSSYIKPTSASNSTSPAQHTTVVASSSSVRLPVTKAQSAHYGNSTSSGVASSTQAFSPTGTGASAAGFTSSQIISTSAYSNATATIISSVPTTLTTLVSSPSASSTSSLAATTSAVIVADYYQCGGLNFNGKGDCAAGTVCKYWNLYYSQCVDAASV